MMSKPLPLYERVKAHLAERIARGEWQDGARLPSEHELMASLGASRMTIHRALREMSAAGILRRVQGVGTFIAATPPPPALLAVTDIAEDIAARGNAHRTRIVSLEAIKASAALGQYFALRGGAKLFHSLIIHYENDAAIQLEERYVTPFFAPSYLEQDFSRLTTNRYLQSIAPPTEVDHLIQAITPDSQTQALLEIGPAEPCLRLVRRTWTAAGPATRSILTHPGSRYAVADHRHL
jgi:GntR family histidine utilization transcriptional repressor